MKGIGAGIGKRAVTPVVQQNAPSATETISAMKVALDGDRIIVSASVDLADAKRLVKRIQANIDLLESEGDSEPPTRQRRGRQLRRPRSIKNCYCRFAPVTV
jgi:hypothetical protein